MATMENGKAEGKPQLYPALALVGAGRFELPTSRTRTVRATKLRYAPKNDLSQKALISRS